MKLIFLLLFIVTLSFSQITLKENNFNDALKEDIVVVEFYAEWNKDNMVDLTTFKDVKTYILNVEQCPALVKKYNILSVPTLIVFYNKEVAEKYEADLTFKLSIKEAHKKVEELILKKFM